jgi:bacillithiol system protein YtxJ
MFDSLFSTPVEIPVLKTVEDCQAALSRGFVILFKHSLSCPVSSTAKEEVTAYARTYPHEPVFILYVHKRELARYVEEATGVPHASPQVIVLRECATPGVVSHYRITVDSIAKLARQ